MNIAPHVEGKDVLMRSNFEGVRNLCNLLDRSTETIEVEFRDGGRAMEWADVQMAIVVGHVLHNFSLCDDQKAPKLPFALRKRVLGTLKRLQDEALEFAKESGEGDYTDFAAVADRLHACLKSLPVISASADDGGLHEGLEEGSQWEPLSAADDMDTVAHDEGKEEDETQKGLALSKHK